MSEEKLVPSAETLARCVKFKFCNYRDIEREYLVEPIETWFGKTEHHPLFAQWFLKGTDVERGVVRDFPLTALRFVM